MFVLPNITMPPSKGHDMMTDCIDEASESMLLRICLLDILQIIKLNLMSKKQVSVSTDYREDDIERVAKHHSNKTRVISRI